MLQDFYQQSRYARFGEELGDFHKDYELLGKFLIKHCPGTKEQSAYNYRYVDYQEQQKEILGRSIGKLIKFYYEAIHSRCDQLGIYAYEVPPCSKAGRVLLGLKAGMYAKDSLQQAHLEDKRSFQEMIVYLLNNDWETPMLKLLRDLDPFDFDESDFNQYLEGIFNGDYASSGIVDMTTTIIEEDYPGSTDKTERASLLDIIANSGIDPWFGEDDDGEYDN
jgi:hypothetical protein